MSHPIPTSLSRKKKGVTKKGGLTETSEEETKERNQIPQFGNPSPGNKKFIK